jgi:hypothetical protein
VTAMSVWVYLLRQLRDVVDGNRSTAVVGITDRDIGKWYCSVTVRQQADSRTIVTLCQGTVAVSHSAALKVG